jgi:hypothetical protein
LHLAFWRGDWNDSFIFDKAADSVQFRPQPPLPHAPEILLTSWGVQIKPERARMLTFVWVCRFSAII